MIQKPTQASLLETQVGSALASSVIATTSVRTDMTIFAIPKPFEGHVGVIQRNAIRSWARLQPRVEIVLFGQDDPELTRIADEVDARLVPLGVNDNGTPLLADAFDFVHANCESTLFCYINCDIMFGADLLAVADRLTDCDLTSFLGIGQRRTVNVVDELPLANSQNFNAANSVANSNDEARAANDAFEQIDLANRDVPPDSIVCKDYFLFTPDLFQKVPGFLVGRGNWDNWMVAHAKSKQVPVVDLTDSLTALHQHHDYSHVAGGRRNAYVFGDEARENQRLAGGRHLVYGSTSTWELGKKGLKKRRIPMLSMLKDAPKFLSLLRNLLILGYLLAGTPFWY